MIERAEAASQDKLRSLRAQEQVVIDLVSEISEAISAATSVTSMMNQAQSERLAGAALLGHQYAAIRTLASAMARSTEMATVDEERTNGGERGDGDMGLEPVVDSVVSCCWGEQALHTVAPNTTNNSESYSHHGTGAHSLAMSTQFNALLSPRSPPAVDRCSAGDREPQRQWWRRTRMPRR